MRTRIKRIIAVCAVVVMLASGAGITAMTAYAAAEGAYIAQTMPSYKNPETNEVEDAGGEDSAVLGQAMTESAVYEKALVEIDSEGRIFITVRMQLMDNIENPRFEEKGQELESEIVQEDFENDTADFRIEVKDFNSFLRCSMNVTAMGRDVVFYLSFKNLQPGTGDFLTSMNPAAQAPETEAEPETGEESPEPETGEDSPEAETEKEAENAGIQEFDDKGRAVNSESPSDPPQKSAAGSFGVIFGIAAAAAAVVFAVWYFGFFRKKK